MSKPMWSAGVAIAVWLMGSAYSDTIYVADNNCPGSGTEADPYCSIQMAINNAVDTDQIIVGPGTYNETIDFLGKAVNLRSAQPTDPDVVANTIIDATGFFHAVQCVSGEGPDSILDGFTITGGNANGSFPDSVGGGMYNDSSSPTVANCIFSGNSSSFDGGGMFNASSSPTVSNCSFSSNTTTAGSGGGMCNDNSSPAVADCTFSGNTANASFPDGLGGGMCNKNSSPTVTQCTFSGNSADRGGGMYDGSSSPTVTGCSFSGNHAGSLGGGMSNRVGSTPTVTGCSFSGNTAGLLGGGMYNSSSSPTVTDCPFSGNSSASLGGGMHNTSSSSPVVTNCSFSENTTNRGAGMYTFNGSPAVTNCTFSANEATQIGGGMSNSSSNSMVTNCILWDNVPDEIEGDGVVTYSDVQGGWPGLDNINAIPSFVDPVNGDFRLSPGSACIDVGLNSAVPEGIDTDLDGNPRFVDDPDTEDNGIGDPPVVDMGAYEFQTGCPWDCAMPADGQVSVADFLALLAQWGTTGNCDTDGEGTGVTDFLALLANWGPCP